MERVLAIECASEACSVALFRDGELAAADHRILGRGHAEHLVPMIAGLPNRGICDRILVSLGPGSFTGVRIGIATARALGVAWDAKVYGYPTLALVAQTAASEFSNAPLTIAMNGGHGEWFVQSFGPEMLPETPPMSLVPERAATLSHEQIAGTRAHDLVALKQSGRAIELHPDARYAMALVDDLLTEDLTPQYGRAPDAKPAKVRVSP